MIRLADTEGMYLVRKHDIDYIEALGDRSCTNCIVPLYTVFTCNKSAQIEKLLRIVL